MEEGTKEGIFKEKFISIVAPINKDCGCYCLGLSEPQPHNWFYPFIKDKYSGLKLCKYYV